MEPRQTKTLGYLLLLLTALSSQAAWAWKVLNVHDKPAPRPADSCQHFRAYYTGVHASMEKNVDRVIQYGSRGPMPGAFFDLNRDRKTLMDGYGVYPIAVVPKENVFLACFAAKYRAPSDRDAHVAVLREVGQCLSAVSCEDVQRAAGQEIEKLVRELGHEEFQRREAAEQALLRKCLDLNSRVELETLIEALRTQLQGIGEDIEATARLDRTIESCSELHSRL